NGAQGGLQLVVAANDGGGLRHHVAQLLMNEGRVFAAAGPLEQSIVPRLMLLFRLLEERGRQLAGRLLLSLQQRFDSRRDDQAAEDAGEERIRPQAVGSVILIVALT